MRTTRSLYLPLLLVVLVIVPAVSATEQITNGGFEAGDFTGWSTSGHPTINENSHTGSYQAFVVDSSGNTWINQTVDLTNVNNISFWYAGDGSPKFYIGNTLINSSLSAADWSYNKTITTSYSGNTVISFYVVGWDSLRLDDVSAISETPAPAIGFTTAYPIASPNETRYTQVSANLPAEGYNLSINATPGQFEPASLIIKPNQTTTDYQIKATVLTDITNTSNTIPTSAMDIKLVLVDYQADDSLTGTYYNGVQDYVLTPEKLVNNLSSFRTNRTAQTNEVYDFTSNTFVHLDNTTIDTVPLTLQIHDNKTALGFPQNFSVVGGENLQVWITEHVPSTQRAGNYSGIIWFNSSTMTSLAVNFSVRVLPITLQNTSLEYAMYYLGQPLYLYDYGYHLGTDARALTDHNKTQAQIALEMTDMKNHGVRYPTMYDVWYNGTEGDPDNAVLVQQNFTASLITRNQSGLPLDHIYLMNSIMNTPQGHLSNPAKQTSDMLARLNELKAASLPYGVGKIYGYSADEGSDATYLSYYPAHATVYNNGGGTYYAINTPGTGLVISNVTSMINIAGAINTTELALWRSANPSTKVFSYANPQGGVENSEIYRQKYGFELWRSGFDGSMVWAYQARHGTSIWNDYDSAGTNYRDEVFAYPTSSGVIDTIQWEGYREGVDDSRYADTLTTITGNTTEATTIINAGISAGQDMSDIRNTIIDHILSYGGAVIPTASFTKDRPLVRIPQLVTVNDTSINDPIAWNWSFGDGQYAATQNATHGYTTAGNYTITLTASNAAGSDSASDYVLVENATVDFSAFQISGTRTVLFTDLTNNDPTSWIWQYRAQGQSGWTQFNNTSGNPTYTFDPGKYDINMTSISGDVSGIAIKLGYIDTYTFGANPMTSPVNQGAIQSSIILAAILVLVGLIVGIYVLYKSGDVSPETVLPVIGAFAVGILLLYFIVIMGGKLGG